MRRREFIAGLGSATVWPLAARAQQPRMPVIGYLSIGFADDYKMVTVPFHRGAAVAPTFDGHYACWRGDRVAGYGPVGNT
jgi:putative tryptophan/tyrosine transport system substrate-binding protein